MALAFSFDLGVFSEGRGVVAGRLSVRPDSGVVAPGEALVCQVAFEAGVQPQVFEGDLRCRAWPAEEPGAAAGAADASAGGGEGCGGARSPGAAERRRRDQAWQEEDALLGRSVAAAADEWEAEQWRRRAEGNGAGSRKDEEVEEIIMQHPHR